MSQITRELAQPPVAPPALDDALFKPNEDERAFLHNAVSTDDDEVRRRVIEVQREAYSVYPYPCLRGFHHVALMMSQNPIYTEILQSGAVLGDEALFLDLGCCMGTDVRKLAADGYPASRIAACDLRPIFIELGHKLYADAATCRIRFFTSDVLALPPDAAPAPALPLEQVTDLPQLARRVRHLYTGALFHLFDEPTQRALARRLALLVRRAPGSAIFGRHQGLRAAGYIDDHLGRLRYGHSPLSWPAMWRAVFEEVYGEPVELEIQAELGGTPQGLHQAMQGQLVWSVTIV